MFGITPDWFFYNIQHVMAAIGLLLLVTVLLARLVDTIREVLLLIIVSAIFVLLAGWLFSGATSSARDRIADTTETRHDVVTAAYTAPRDCSRNDCSPYEHHWTTKSKSCSRDSEGKESCTTTTHHHEEECFETIEEHWVVTNFGHRSLLGFSLPDNFERIRVDRDSSCTKYGSRDVDAPTSWLGYRESIITSNFDQWPVHNYGVNYYSAFLNRSSTPLERNGLPTLYYDATSYGNYFIPDVETCGFPDETTLNNEWRSLTVALSLSGYDINPLFVWNCDLSDIEGTNEVIVEKYRRNNMANNAVIFVMHLNPENRMIVDGMAFTAYPGENERLSDLFDRNVTEMRVDDINLFFGTPFPHGDIADTTAITEISNIEIKWDPGSLVFWTIKEVYTAPDSGDYAEYKNKIPIYWSDVIWRVILVVVYFVFTGGIHLGMAARVDFNPDN